VTRSIAIISTLVLVGLAGIAPAAAGHARAGLWKLTDTTPARETGDKPTVYIGEYCRTPVQAAHDEPQVVGRDCVQSNVKWNGNTVSGDVVCTGRISGAGKFRQTFPNDMHYTGDWFMDTHTILAGSIHVADSFTAVWERADCGKVPALK
jgi:hypothetical protein